MIAGSSITTSRTARARSTRSDWLLGVILVVSVALLIASGWALCARLVRHTTGTETMIVGVMLNLALVMLGWRRYHDLAAALAKRDRSEASAATPAQHDELTGFLTRRAFGDESTGAITRALRRGASAAILVIDLDHFHTVNDLHGHLAGDTVLRAAADAIRRALPPGAIAGRLDGDEFAVLLPFDPRHTGTVDALAEFVVGTLAQPIATRGVTAHIGGSIGIARSETDCTRIEPLLRRATIALHAAKTTGRNRHAWFDATMERALIERNTIEAGLRDGIPAGEFVPYYEQQVDLATGALNGFEVLARWEHPTRGTICPDAFITVAEECGLISDLSIAVMRRAFTEARDWDPSLTLSVNISPYQLRDPWLAQKLVKLLIETGFPANRLEIEITESALFQNLSLAQSIVGSLKNQGIRLALDDFGTGYSSLAHLRALPFDRIKIDRSFVASMISDPESAAIVSAISRLGDSLNLPITAEGIEDGAILAQLAAIGCAKGQGWHFGKPMAIGAARRMLAERGLLPAARTSGDGAPVTRRRSA